MNLNIVDIIVIISILFFGIIGLKRGVFKQLIIFVGLIIIIIISYKLKNIVGDFLVLNIPFMDFPKFLKGASVLNIVIYQSIAFMIVLLLLSMLYKALVAFTGLFEKILRATIILGLPSKILGFVIGLVEGYIIVYILLFFAYQPAFKFNFIEDSKYASSIVNNTPILASYANDTLEIVNDIYDLKNVDNADEFNYKLLDIILDKKVTSVDVVEKLVSKKKINFENVDELIQKYKEEQ